MKKKPESKGMTLMEMAQKIKSECRSHRLCKECAFYIVSDDRSCVIGNSTSPNRWELPSVCPHCGKEVEE